MKLEQVNVIIGAQYGSEGKGAYIGWLTDVSRMREPFVVIRTGGPQAGHSIKVLYDRHHVPDPQEGDPCGVCGRDRLHPEHSFGRCEGSTTLLGHGESKVRVQYRNTGYAVFKMRQVPCAWANPKAQLIIGPGALIHLETLLDEIRTIHDFCEGQPHLRDVQGRLFIDPMAVIVEQHHRDREQGCIFESKSEDLVARIGSTGEGVGAATADLVMRRARLARDMDELRPWLADTEALIHQRYHGGSTPIIIESTQGYLLSLRRSGLYPTVTSRDITPAQVLNDAGVPSKWPHTVTAIMRTYPIRVAGPSGPFGGQELTWEELSARTHGYIKEERTTVTRKVRRVAEFSYEEARAAIRALVPDQIILTFFDYLFPELADRDTLTPEAMQTARLMQEQLGVPVPHVGTGFQTFAPTN